MTYPESGSLGGSLTIDHLELNQVEFAHVLREREPVTYLAALDGWFVSRRDLAEEVLKDDEHFGTDSPDFKPQVVFGATMLNLDGEEHDRHRCPFDPAFRVRVVRDRYSDHIQAVIEALVAELSKKSTFDLGKDYASRVAISVVANALGLELDIDEVRSVYDRLAAAIADYRNDPSVMADARSARSRFAGALGSEMGRARGDLDSLIGDVLRTEGGLSEDEVLANALVIMFGGIETVESTIVNTAWCLFSHPEQLEFTRANDAWQAAVDEALRVAPPLGFLGRVVRRDTALGGVEMAEGDKVFANIVAANRDPMSIDEPDRFQVERARAGQYLSFGQGPHFCLGYNLARLEGAMAVRAVFEAFPDLMPDGGEVPPLHGFSLIRPAGGLMLRVGG